MNNIILWSKIRDLARGEENINKHLARNIIENKYSLNNYSLEQFAKITNCSKPTIIRFCNAIGISGFNELKFRLETIIYENKILKTDFNISTNGVDDEINYSVILSQTQNYIDSVKVKNEIKIFVETIESAKNIYIFAMNLAYNFCKNFTQRLRWLNKYVILENDLNTIEGYLDTIEKDDLVILVSLSGNSKYINQFVKHLNGKVIFGLLGENGELLNYVSNSISIPQYESSFWDSFSIRGQALIQILDYIFLGLIKKQ